RLDSRKEIASYLNRSEKTVRRWEEGEKLPVHRLLHEKRGSVYAYADELDAWWNSRKLQDGTSAESPNEQLHDLGHEVAVAPPEEQGHPEIRGPTLDDKCETETLEAGEQKTTAPTRPRHTVVITSLLIFVIGLLAAVYGAGFRGSMRKASPSRI